MTRRSWTDERALRAASAASQFGSSEECGKPVVATGAQKRNAIEQASELAVGDELWSIVAPPCRQPETRVVPCGGGGDTMARADRGGYVHSDDGQSAKLRCEFSIGFLQVRMDRRGGCNFNDRL